MSKTYPTPEGKVLGLVIIGSGLFWLFYNFIYRDPPKTYFELGANFILPVLLIWLGYAFFIGRLDVVSPITFGPGTKGSG